MIFSSLMNPIIGFQMAPNYHQRINARIFSLLSTPSQLIIRNSIHEIVKVFNLWQESRMIYCITAVKTGMFGFNNPPSNLLSTASLKSVNNIFLARLKPNSYKSTLIHIFIRGSCFCNTVTTPKTGPRKYNQLEPSNQ